MKPPWPARFLDYLDLVDVQEAPHGLYGIQQAHFARGRLPTLAEVLGARGRVDPLKQCGFGNPSLTRRSYSSTDRRPDVLCVSAGAERIWLQILNHATTKVRHYGSAFRLDKRHVKPPREPLLDLESLVPKLGRDSSETHAILLVAHYVSAREFAGVLGKTTDPAFLDRYTLLHEARDRDDRYERGFRTALHLWAPQSDAAEPDAEWDVPIR